MRTFIFNRIKNLASLPAPYKADGQIVSSGAADNMTAPFIVVRMDVEQPVLGMPSEARVQSVPFTVMVHDSPGSMIRIDEAAAALKKELPSIDSFMVGGMSVYGIEWTGTGMDVYDDHYGTNYRPVQFTMMTRRAG